MPMKIEIFSDSDLNKLQHDVNQFLRDKKVEVISLTQSEWALAEPLSRGVTITVLYREQEAPKPFGFSSLEPERAGRVGAL